MFRNAVLSGIEALRKTLRLTAVAIAALTLLAVAAFYLLLIRRQFDRLDRLRIARRQIGQEDFGVLLPASDGDEIGQSYCETNRMGAALATRRDEVAAEWDRLNDTIAARIKDLRAANAALAEIDDGSSRTLATS